MDYEKILKRIVQIINTTENSDIGFTNICTYIGENCPELQKSEDEKIRKDVKRAISVALDYSYFDKETANNCLAWLEKQGNKSEEYVFRPTAGCTIDEAAQQAVDKAANGENIVFSFNGFYIKIYNNTTINDIINSYNDFCKNNVRKTQNDVMKMK